MLTSIRQTHSEFFRQFHNLKIMVGDKSITLLSRYARKSSFDYVEEQENQIYPCIAIMDYTPVPSRDWFVDMKTYFGGKGFSELTGYLYRRPVRMEFRYDVSIVSKSYNEFLAIQDYFNSTFVSQTGFLFNKKVVDGDEVGDVVLYTVRPTDIPRTDGVYEMNYEFTLKPWIYAVKPKEVELVQAIILRSKMFEQEIIINPGEGFPYTLPLNLE